MTIQEQIDLADEMQFHRSPEQEMKLRRMAVDAATTRERPARFPVLGPVFFHQNGHDPAAPPRELPYRVVVVDLWSGLVDYDMRVLVAEAILRPQLRDAGWRV